MNLSKSTMFEDRQKDKELEEKFFGSYGNGKPWTSYQETGDPKIDKTDPNAAPYGEYFEPEAPHEHLNQHQKRNEWFGVRKGGTKHKRLIKNNVLTARSVSIVRMIPEDKHKEMKRASGEVNRIVGTFVPHHPHKYISDEQLDQTISIDKLGLPINESGLDEF